MTPQYSTVHNVHTQREHLHTHTQQHTLQKHLSTLKFLSTYISRPHCLQQVGGFIAQTEWAWRVKQLPWGAKEQKSQIMFWGGNDSEAPWPRGCPNLATHVPVKISLKIVKNLARANNALGKISESFFPFISSLFVQKALHLLRGDFIWA